MKQQQRPFEFRTTDMCTAARDSISDTKRTHTDHKKGERRHEYKRKVRCRAGACEVEREKMINTSRLR